MNIGFNAVVQNPNAVIDYITCRTCGRGKKETYTLKWERSEWNMDRCPKGYLYDAWLKAVMIEDENGREEYANGMMDLMRSFTHFECCLRDRDTEAPVDGKDIGIHFFEVMTDGNVVSFDVPVKTISVEGLKKSC